MTADNSSSSENLRQTCEKLRLAVESIVTDSGAGSRIDFFKGAGRKGSPEAMNTIVSQAFKGKRPLAGTSLSIIRSQIKKTADIQAFNELVERHKMLVRFANGKRGIPPNEAKTEIANAVRQCAMDDFSIYEKTAADSELAFPTMAILVAWLSASFQDPSQREAHTKMMSMLKETEIPDLLNLPNFPMKSRMTFVARKPWLKAHALLQADPYMGLAYIELIDDVCWEPPSFKDDADRFYVHAGDPLHEFEFRLAR